MILRNRVALTLLFNSLMMLRWRIRREGDNIRYACPKGDTARHPKLIAELKYRKQEILEALDLGLVPEKVLQKT